MANSHYTIETLEPLWALQTQIVSKKMNVRYNLLTAAFMYFVGDWMKITP